MRTILLMSCIALLGFQSAFAQDWTKAADYLSYMNNQQKTINEDMWAYIKASAHSDEQQKVQQKKQRLLETLGNAKSQIARMPPFSGKTTLRDSMLAYLRFMEKFTKKQYTRTEHLDYQLSRSYYAMKNYLEKQQEVRRRFDQKSKEIHRLIKTFAKGHAINLVEKQTDLRQKMRIANEVNQYFNKVFLVDYRISMAKNTTIEAINEQDTAKIKNLRDSILHIIHWGKEKLANIPPYAGDQSLKKTCRKNLNKAATIARKHLPEVLKLYRLKKQVKQLKTQIESKAPEERTKQEVDRYKTVINRYNNHLNGYNQTVKTVNQLQKKGRKRWEKTSKAFRAKHVPK